MPIPKIKTGPTYGQERSRNQDGRWRRKRSDTGIERVSTNKTALNAIEILLNIFKFLITLSKNIFKMFLSLISFITTKIKK